MHDDVLQPFSTWYLFIKQKFINNSTNDDLKTNKAILIL